MYPPVSRGRADWWLTDRPATRLSSYFASVHYYGTTQYFAQATSPLFTSSSIPISHLDLCGNPASGHGARRLVRPLLRRRLGDDALDRSWVRRRVDNRRRAQLAYSPVANQQFYQREFL